MIKLTDLASDCEVVLTTSGSLSTRSLWDCRVDGFSRKSAVIEIPQEIIEAGNDVIDTFQPESDDWEVSLTISGGAVEMFVSDDLNVVSCGTWFIDQLTTKIGD